jgi:hypothetical protein
LGNAQKYLYLRRDPNILNKAVLIRELKGTEQERRLIVDEQSADDIIKEVCKAHKEHTADYDRIAHYFAGGSVRDVCERLWVFCRTQLIYRVESVKVQNVGCPYWILTHEVVDCKNYASFIAGVIDSLKRQGLNVVWEFRFISDRPFSLFDRRADHVFVVVNPATDDIWVDPVLGAFDEHIYYFYRASRRIRTGGTLSGRVGAIGGVQMGLTSVESGLLADVKSYADGLTGNIQQTLSTSTFTIVTEAVLTGIATAAFGPVALVALAALKAGAVALDKEYGVGAVSSRLLTDLSNLNIAGLFNDVFNGRTYQTDQYWAAVYYQYYVLGNNITDINFISDSMVLPALKWFVDRSGVFISGRQHIIGLTQSALAYSNQYSGNSDTTTDMTLVNAASMMAKTNWPNPGNFSPAMLGAWKNTIGVYDQALVNLAASYGETPEQYTAQTGIQDANAAAYTASATQPAIVTFLKGSTLISGIPNWLIFAAGGGILIFALRNSKK